MGPVKRKKACQDLIPGLKKKPWMASAHGFFCLLPAVCQRTPGGRDLARSR